MNAKRFWVIIWLFVSYTSTISAWDYVRVLIDDLYYNLNAQSQTAEVARDGNYSGDIVIPVSVTYNNATYSVTSIGDEAFWNCSGLTSVTIPNSVTYIGDEAFLECTGLTSVTIPNSVTNIGRSAFNRCSGLTSITIPNSVTSIGDWALYGCSGLTSVTIPNSVTYIEGHAFSGCSGLTNITIGNSVTSIGDRAFLECTGLTSVTIPNSVTNIGRSAFGYCTSLTSITIPNGVTSIGEKAFYACPSVLSIINYATTPQVIGANTFGGDEMSNKPGINKATCKLYVPLESIYAYRAAKVWSSFIILPIGTEGIENTTNDFNKSGKTIRDGQVFIQKGNHIYSVTGQGVR